MELIQEADLRSCSLTENSRVLCALSGGADSTALLLELCRLQKEGRIAAVGAAHFEHGIRGEESWEDMRFCRELSQKLGIPFFYEQADVPGEAGKEHLSLETAARKLRYAFLRRTAEAAGYDSIALAHHAMDQAETLLFHLVRGAGLTGLCGMEPKNGLLVRPLLRHSKEELLRYLKAAGQEYRIDSTNALLDSDRNRIRLSVLPLLESMNPRAAEHIAETAEKLRAEEAFLEALTKEAMLRCDGSRKRIFAEPSVIRSRILLRLIKEQTRDYSEGDVQKLRALLTAQSGQVAELTGGIKARAEGDAIFFFRDETPGFAPVALKIGTKVPLPSGGTLLAKECDSARLPCPKNEGYADADTIHGTLTVRAAKAGERLIPFGMRGSKLFSDFYTDKKVPLSERNRPVVFDGEKPVYVCGFTVDDRVKVTEKTRNYIHFLYNEGED